MVRARGWPVAIAIGVVLLAGASSRAIAADPGEPDAGPPVSLPADGTTAGPAAESPLAPRLEDARRAVGADTALDLDRRGALQAAIGRLLPTARIVDAAAARLAAASAARTLAEPMLDPVDVDASFERWRQALPSSPAPTELWSLLARLGEERLAMRRNERGLLVGALGDDAALAQSDGDLWSPVALEALVASLPEAPVHTRIVTGLAREVEDRRIAIAAESAAARRQGLAERLDRVGAERAAISSRMALIERKLDYLDRELARVLGAALAAIRAASRAALPDTVAATVLELADETERLLARSARIQRDTATHAVQLDAIARLAADTRERLTVQGGTQATGLVLVTDLAQTLAPGEVAADLADVRRELADLRLLLIELRPRILAARDPNAAMPTRDLLDRLRVAGAAGASELESMRFRLLLNTETAARATADALVGDEATLTELERRNRELRALIGGRMLWTRSHAPVDWPWLSQLGERGAGGSFGAAPLSAAADSSAELIGAMRHPLTAVTVALALAAWIGLWIRHRRLMAMLAGAGVQDLMQGIRAVVRALLLAVPPALALGLMFRLARGGEPPSGFYGSVVHGTLPAFWTVLVLVGMLVIASPSGPGAVVLGWSDSARRGLRRLAAALLLLIGPSHIAVTTAWYRGDLMVLQYEARALFILAWSGIAIVLWHALRPGGVWFGVDSGRRALARRALRVALTLGPLSAAAASALGYQITAMAIANQFEGSLGVLASLLIVYGLALRGVALAEMRAAQRYAVQQRLAAMEGQASGDLAPPVASPEPDDVSGADMRRLVGATVAVVGAIWLGVLWAGLLPAVLQLDEIALWHVSVGSGAAETRVVVSLLDLLAAVAVAVGFGVGLRVVPGLLDALLRDRTAVESGTRYAIGAMTRYAIVLIGMIATLGLIGVRWSHLQWMAAALTVGLGFGLQEIFANFVSGLILLFERPVRVGDVVTVGDVTGTVTRISTRATTVMDFDRREVLIPNKALITDRLVNWTLSNEVTRITVKVGVGYGTDPDLAHRLLRQAAAECPMIVSTPPPLTVFMGFGASNLDFELRACVGKFNDRVSASNELHARIVALFAAAGVSIDYDQIDVRLIGSPPAAGATAPPVD